MSILLDTCVLSEAWKFDADPGVLEWLEHQEEQSLFLSSLTIGELTKGVLRMPAGSRRDRLGAWVGEALPARFKGRILGIDAGIATRWGAMLAEAEKRGEVLPAIDSLIAATAAFHDFTIATRNEHDFMRCSVPVINPWNRA